MLCIRVSQHAEARAPFPEQDYYREIGPSSFPVSASRVRGKKATLLKGKSKEQNLYPVKSMCVCVCVSLCPRTVSACVSNISYLISQKI